MNSVMKGIILICTIAIGCSFLYANTTGCIGTGTECHLDTTINLIITPGDICIGSQGVFDFGTHTVSSESQTITSTFSSPFWVEDLRGSDQGYYTTVQIAQDLIGPGGSTIPATNIAMIASNTLDTTAGSTNPNVILNANITSSYLTLHTPRTLFQRLPGANFGLVGRYETIPLLKLTLPAYQSVGQYNGTLVYTLYEQDSPPTNSYPSPDEWTDENYFVMNTNNTAILDYIGPNGIDIIIPAEINGVSITSIGNNAFRDKQITSITIPNSVVSIGQAAFLSNNLTSLIIPDSVVSIGLYAFRNNKLTSVTIPDSVSTIGLRAFLLNNLTSITLPHSITSMSSEVFKSNGPNRNSVDNIPRSPITAAHGTRNLVGTTWVKQ